MHVLTASSLLFARWLSHIVYIAGEERDVGYAQDNYLAFEAHQDISAGSGSMIIYWPNVPGFFGNASWPTLDEIVILGLPSINASSVSILVSNPALADAALESLQSLISSTHNSSAIIISSPEMTSILSTYRSCS